MRHFVLVILCLLFVSAEAQNISTTRPWTYWWWMGSAVSKEDITSQLEQFSKNGLGGVHIIPIYGVKGYESHFIPFLSAEWLAMMKHTVREGKRLGIGVDMTTGTGWPFGGPNVTRDLAAKTMTERDGKWIITPTRQEVKRAAPGGAGLVFDPFHPSAMSKYLTRFDTAFAGLTDLPRAMYMDSYEAYGANWTDDFISQFKRRRGYDLQDQAALLKDTTNSEGARLVRIDYHQILAELLRERYAHAWTKWSTNKGFLTRYQAHGSPGNLLDLYDEADIPETESFGTSRFPIPGLRVDPDYSVTQFGTPNPLAMKFASSAAHFSGKKLVSSETGTWLANHFKVSLSQVKPQIDELFTAGINHIFYHGTTYSPANEAYPGWLFYASTNFGASSHFAEHFSLLNNYVERCQNLLQESQPDQDVLVYFPIHDLWSTPAKSAGGVHLLEVHRVDRWLLDLPFGKLTQKLWKTGYTFDYVSDSQLSRLKTKSNGDVSAGSASYKTILIPRSTYMPGETLAQLARLASSGARIIFENNMPSVVAGYQLHKSHQDAFDVRLATLKQAPGVQVVFDWQAALKASGVVQEDWAASGLTFIRKMKEGKAVYFVANVGNTFREGWIKLGKANAAKRYDPLTGEAYLLKGRRNNEVSEVFLSLLPGQSCFLTGEADVDNIVSENISVEKEFPVNGEWQISFLKGKPKLPAGAKMKQLKSWTLLPDSAVYFSGTGRYMVHFDITAGALDAGKMILDLGDVREVAAVKINGQSIGVAWSIPFRLEVKPGILKEKNNILEVDVSNLSANYMRLRDRQLPDWKKFYDINVADITYKKFDASNWSPMPSGLLGPVRLLYR